MTADKKRHTVKNTVMARPDKGIIFLGRSFSGHKPDYLRLKQELPPELDWFTDLHIRVDLVPRHFVFDGYRRRSVSRAFIVVQRHTIVA